MSFREWDVGYVQYILICSDEFLSDLSVECCDWLIVYV